jgi:hypothetical protein
MATAPQNQLMMLQGTVQNGVVVLPPGVELPEGSVVQIVPQSPAAKEADQSGNIWDDLLALAKEVESIPCDLPEDLAINHDHYLYGAPKRQ